MPITVWMRQKYLSFWDDASVVKWHGVDAAA
jgi:hypothetical protein